jgi:hypothetical protein
VPWYLKRPSAYRLNLSFREILVSLLNLTNSCEPSSSIVIATGYGLDGRVSILARSKILFLSVKTGSEARPACYPMGTGGIFL